MKRATVTADLGTLPPVRNFALVVETKSATGGNPFAAKRKKRADAKPDEGPQPGGTIDGEPQTDVTDPADPAENEPDHGAGADAQPFDQTQRPQAEDTIFSTADDTQNPDGTPSNSGEPADATQPDGNPDPNQPTPDAAAPQWAGDLDETGDQSDPAQAFRSFTGANGEQAWLDRAPDGTLTGWVKDTDGSVYRYTDADAWAIDVDDAHMTRAGADHVASPAPADTSAAPGGMEGKSLRRVVRRSTPR